MRVLEPAKRASEPSERGLNLPKRGFEREGFGARKVSEPARRCLK